ncbi:unnamed protein product [Amoebophrya sp. A25]|nr:unnamed protein product [Amoebophrya sp. A25]|eukprot:GSA25T00008586001.1
MAQSVDDLVSQALGDIAGLDMQLGSSSSSDGGVQSAAGGVQSAVGKLAMKWADPGTAEVPPAMRQQFNNVKQHLEKMAGADKIKECRMWVEKNINLGVQQVPGFLYGVLKKETKFQTQLHLLYVVHDVLQCEAVQKPNSRHWRYIPAIKPYLPWMLRCVHKTADTEVDRNKVLNLLNLWVERKCLTDTEKEEIKTLVSTDEQLPENMISVNGTSEFFATGGGGGSFLAAQQQGGHHQQAGLVQPGHQQQQQQAGGNWNAMWQMQQNVMANTMLQSPGGIIQGNVAAMQAQQFNNSNFPPGPGGGAAQGGQFPPAGQIQPGIIVGVPGNMHQPGGAFGAPPGTTPPPGVPGAVPPLGHQLPPGAVPPQQVPAPPMQMQRRTPESIPVGLLATMLKTVSQRNRSWQTAFYPYKPLDATLTPQQLPPYERLSDRSRDRLNSFLDEEDRLDLKEKMRTEQQKRSDASSSSSDSGDDNSDSSSSSDSRSPIRDKKVTKPSIFGLAPNSGRPLGAS